MASHLNKDVMYQSTQIKIFPLLLAFLALYSCSVDSGSDSSSISPADVELVTRIVAESLSDENSGILGSIDDAITTVSASGFIRNPLSKEKTAGHDDKTGRGVETNTFYSFDPGTGIHLFRFDRLVTLPNYVKNTTDTTRFVYRNSQKSALEFPSQSVSEIETINYIGSRVGSIDTPNYQSFFTRTDTFFVSGLSAGSAVSQIEGKHTGRGSFSLTDTTTMAVTSRNYSLEINFLNVRIENISFNRVQGVEQNLRGSLTYTLRIESAASASDFRVVRGSIDLVGDGTASMRLSNQPTIFQVNLDNGQIRNQSTEFEGQIRTIHAADSTITLFNGIRVRIRANTKIERDGDLFSLGAVQNALLAGEPVRAEGEGFIQNNIFIATSIEFEIDDDGDDENNDIDFKSRVVSVDLNQQTFELQNGLIIQIDSSTEIEDDGDFLSLEEVNSALTQGGSIIADGEARYVEGDINFIAGEVEFKLESSGGDDDDNGGGTVGEIVDFEEEVDSVNVNSNQLILKNGIIIQVTSETVITGDFTTLQEVQDALSQGLEIEADGEGTVSSSDSVLIIVADNIEFEIED